MDHGLIFIQFNFGCYWIFEFDTFIIFVIVPFQSVFPKFEEKTNTLKFHQVIYLFQCLQSTIMHSAFIRFGVNSSNKTPIATDERDRHSTYCRQERVHGMTVHC